MYTARYFGHKLHLDQNEKLIHYGVTYVLARDGYSGKIVAGALMSVKNNSTIYEQVYRAATLTYGLWEQVRVDLTLYIHEQLRLAGLGITNIVPYRQVSSTHNHIIERIWMEVNHRVTYPIKRVVITMEEQGRINMGSPTVKFCVSTVLQSVSKVGLKRMIEAWNNHLVLRGGIPNQLQTAAYNTSCIHPSEIPEAATAVQQYRQQGGSITDPHPVGEDPLASDLALVQQQQEEWTTRCGMSPEQVFTQLMSGNTQGLEDAIITLIDITNELEV